MHHFAGFAAFNDETRFRAEPTIQQTVVNRKMPISIQRQVQITAGMMVLIGVVLGFVVSPWFFLLSGFVGAGLTFAGVSGTCAMASLLALMPWNRRALA